MFLSGYVFAFVIGVAVGFVFSSIMLFGNRLDHIFWADKQEQDCSIHLPCAKLPLGQGAFSVRCPDPQQLSAAVAGVFFIGIGFALVKQLVGVDIGFTPLAVRWPPSAQSRWGFFCCIFTPHSCSLKAAQDLQKKYKRNRPKNSPL